MVKVKTWMGILLLVLIFVMPITGYENDTNFSFADNTALNGTWHGRWLSNTNEDSIEIWRFNNGKYKIDCSSPFLPAERGTYTIYNDKITFVITHIYVSNWHIETFDIENREDRWHSKKELKKATGLNIKDFERWFGYYFSMERDTFIFSVIGDKLTLIWEFEENNDKIILTRR